MVCAICKTRIKNPAYEAGFFVCDWVTMFLLELFKGVFKKESDGKNNKSQRQ